MATLKDIKQRIRSIREIQKITRAMKMVAVAKLRKAQRRQEEFEPFGLETARIFSLLLSGVEEKNHPCLQERVSKKVWVIVLTSDRGLCGAYNHHIEKAVESLCRRPKVDGVSLLVSGRQGWSYFRRRGYNILSFGMPEEIEKRARILARFISRSYLSGAVDRVYVVADRFRLNRERGVRTVQLLPFPREEAQPPEKGTGKKGETSNPQERLTSYLLETGVDMVFDEAWRLHLLNQFYQFYLDSEAAEQLARMTAMDLATANADDLIFDLTLSYNKARQEAITKELIDILGGSQAIAF